MTLVSAFSRSKGQSSYTFDQDMCKLILHQIHQNWLGLLLCCRHAVQNVNLYSIDIQFHRRIDYIIDVQSQ